eukprot:2471006-Amphidinium_carterae.1
MASWKFAPQVQAACDSIVMFSPTEVHLGLVKIAPRFKEPAAGKPWVFTLAFTQGHNGQRLQEFWQLATDWLVQLVQDKAAKEFSQAAPIRLIHPGLENGLLAQQVQASLPARSNAKRSSSAKRSAPEAEENGMVV